MTKFYYLKCVLLCAFVSINNLSNAQSNQETVIGIDQSSTFQTNALRGKNIVMPGGGFSLINGDYQNPVYENFGQIGYKRFLNNSFNVNVNYKKHYLDFDQQEFSDNGFMSFDLNVEYYILPYNKLTPYIYLGSGLVLSNDFDDANNKFQGGLGVEYLVADKIALTLLADGNYILNQDDETIAFQNVDDLYLGAALGIHFYFGKSSNATKRKTSKIAKNLDGKTIINTNPIINNDKE